MKTTKAKSGLRTASRRVTASQPRTKRSAPTHVTTRARRKQLRHTYPLHKRLMLHPLSAFIFLCGGVFMAGWTCHAIAATTISSTVEAPPLTAAATLESPADKSVFTTQSIHITGTCPDNSYVKIKVNGTFNGAGWCRSDNTYDIATSLYRGSNTLIVQDYNSTDLIGPGTAGITVTYTAPATAGATRNTHAAPNTTTSSATSAASSSISNTPANSSSSITVTPTPNEATNTTSNVARDMLLTSDFQFHTFTQQSAFSWDLNLEGGSPPYVVMVDWGDGDSSQLRFPGDPVLTLHHVYQDSGYYAVVVHSTDTTGNQNVMQLAALITGKDGSSPFLNTTDSAGGGKSSSQSHSKTAAGSTSTSPSTLKWLLLAAWPSYLIVILMTTSFWLGERRELTLMSFSTRHRKMHRAR